MRTLVSTIAVICLFLTAPALADMTITLADSVGTVGGEFIATVTGDDIAGYGLGDSFGTFCLETNEYVSFGPTYYVTISGAALAGGSGGGSPDPLAPETAWVYTKWLTDVTFPHTATNANLVQRAIWYIEQESLGVNNILVTQALAAVAGGWTNSDIRVMNLWAKPDHTGYKQDLLVRVPVPGAVILGALGLGVVGWRLRRFA